MITVANIVSFLAVMLLGLVHIFIGRFQFLHGSNGDKWISAFGGVGVAYVFIYLLPKLAVKQQILVEYSNDGFWTFSGVAGYLIALLGLVIFIGIEGSIEERLKSSNTKGMESQAQYSIVPHIIYITGFAFYSFLLGYLFADFQALSNIGQLFLAVIAITLHLIGSDHILYEVYGPKYNSQARWVLVTMLLLGWTLGILTTFSELTMAMCFSFLSGCIVAIALRRELSPHGKVLFYPFLMGVLFNMCLIFGYINLSY